jgi:CBS domain-containing protein
MVPSRAPSFSAAHRTCRAWPPGRHSLASGLEGERTGQWLFVADHPHYDHVMASVGEIMSRDVLAVESTASLVDAATQMHGRTVGAVVVLSEGRLVGILTERDVLRAVATGRVGSSVAEVMTAAPETVDADEPSGQAAALMIHGGFRHLPVVDGATVVGMVSIRDLVRVTVDDEAPRGV